MAPIVAAATSTPKKQAVNTGRVVKRPARGFHRFRNGILNVTPKGGEKELYVLILLLLLRLFLAHDCPGSRATRIRSY